ncbi:hypothetical protein WMQ46_11980 [Vibrio diabolicus]|uniref:hypothetical protein n=1 Tax=Vibrio diabolicus TaxID=50719 RepID=UPI0037533D14
MEKEIIVWTFIVVFIVTSIITLLGVIKNCKWIEIDDKYLKALSGALLLEIAAVIVTFGASSFNEISLESSHEKEIAKYQSEVDGLSSQVDKLKISVAESKKEVELKSEEVLQLRKEKNELIYSLNVIEKASSEPEKYSFSDAKKEFSSREIFFLHASEKLDSSSYALLESIQGKLGGYKNVVVKLHPILPKNGDETLMKKRQLSVRKFLVDKGFPAHRVIFIRNSYYGNVSDEIYNKDDVPIESGMSIDIEVTRA